MKFNVLVTKALMACSLIATTVQSEDIVNVVSINSGTQKTVASALFRQYEASNPDVKINLITLPDGEFKTNLPNWLSSSQSEYDLIFWHGGNRLFSFVKEDQIAPLSQLMDTNTVKNSFTKGSLGAITLNDEIYAVPTSYYQWGMYYRKSTFSENGIQPPKTWDDFIQAGNKLKQNGITPLALGNSGKWPASAWFDYLDLRINGLEFHTELLQGKHSFNDPRVKKVFSHWKRLVDGNFFMSLQDSVDWNEALPFIYHNHAAMILIGNFVSGELASYLQDDFAFMPFPTIDPNVPLYEDAPLDIVMVPSNTTISSGLKGLVSYMASSSFQSQYNQDMGMIPPHVDAKISDGAFIKEGAKLLGSAAGLAQFFDRDTQSAFVEPALDVFARFLTSADIKRAQSELEQLRQTHLITSKP
ncbi:ABC transporter substrate-binding protein [Marinomonas sp. 2405UD68-3]|uniref:ABC transporter substrate-binding protein n=1 Tax=Marinomonas sp. 2405UD68-3 TaxID=3391835 RepID=UPI0039C90465